MGFGDSVWERTGAGELSKNLFAFLTAGFSLLGILVSMAAAVQFQSLELTWLVVIGVLVAGVAGIFIALSSSNPIVSLVGYMMVAFPLGAITGPLVAMYTTASVVKIFFMTSMLVAALGFVGATIPDSLESWGSWLLGGLLILLGGLFVIPIAGFFGLPITGAMTLWDWVGVALFSAYVVYDFNRAMRVAYTFDNAIDCALAIYLDWINLFIRLLRLMGTKKSDD